MAVGYAVILVILIDIFAFMRQFKSFHIYVIFLFLALNAAGAALDIIQETSSLKWPCFVAALLYLYFFIVQFDSKLDTLTGMGNRYSFNEFINKLSKQNAQIQYSIAVIDLDQLKNINETLGHREGDNALKDMALIINGYIRHSDFAARYSGDKFVLVTRAENDIQRILDRIREAVDIQNDNKTRPYRLCMSYGYDTYTPSSGQPIRKFMFSVSSIMDKQKIENRRQWAEKGSDSV